MKQYKRLDDSKIFNELDSLGKWADGSEKIVKEMVNKDPHEWEEVYQIDRKEVFELAKTFSIARMQGGFLPENSWEYAEYLIKKRDGLL